MSDVENIIDADLDAYVDNQLDATSRLRVEKYLSKNPEAAAQVMTDLSIRNALKLSFVEDEEHFRPETREAARRLSSGLSDRQMWNSLRKIAVVGLVFSVGWFAHTSVGTREVNATVHPPAFVEQAVRAHMVSLVRAGMQSQPEIKSYDREDIRAATAIAMPKLPDNWRVIDVQVFPSEFGPSIEAALRTGDGALVSLFASRPGNFDVEPITSLSLNEAEAAWWQIGEVAYAVVSNTPNTGLTDEAETLKNSLY